MFGWIRFLMEKKNIFYNDVHSWKKQMFSTEVNVPNQTGTRATETTTVIITVNSEYSFFGSSNVSKCY